MKNANLTTLIVSLVAVAAVAFFATNMLTDKTVPEPAAEGDVVTEPVEGEIAPESLPAEKAAPQAPVETRTVSESRDGAAAVSEPDARDDVAPAPAVEAAPPETPVSEKTVPEAAPAPDVETNISSDAAAEKSAASAVEADVAPRTEPASSDDGGFTLGIRGGLGIVGNSDVSSPAVSIGGIDYDSLGAATSFDKGYALSLLVGYEFGNGLRLEGEFGYIRNGLKEMNVTSAGTLPRLAGLDLTETPPVPCASGAGGCVPYYDSGFPASARETIERASLGKKKLKGNSSAYTFMLNAYYDLDLGGGFAPYAGGGAGLAVLSIKAESGESLTEGRALVDDKDTAFAYQFGGGVGYEVSERGSGPSVTLTVDYRYFGIVNPSFSGEVTGTMLEAEFRGHYVGAGIRLGF